MSNSTFNASASVVRLSTAIKRNSALAEKQLLEVLGKATRTAYSYDKFDDCNFLITDLPVRFRNVAVSFFKRMGLVVIENRGELPLVKRVDDKSKQKDVFEKMKGMTDLGLNRQADADAVKARADKADERTRKFLADNSINDRVYAYLQTALKQAQTKNDLECVNKLSDIMTKVKKA